MSRVLVVDDNPENLYFLGALLRGYDHEVVEARNGAEALKLASERLPDLVVSDLFMPVMDGYELLRQWKSDETLGVVPFMVYTATYTDPKDERLALDLGADAFIIKPAEPDSFMTCMNHLMANGDSGGDTVSRPREAEQVLLREYNEALVRKLEKKASDLEQANRELREQIAERQRAEAALRESEEQFRQAQKMEAVGQLAGGVAHDFNNLLTVIISYSELVMERLAADDPTRDLIAEINKAGERAATLTRQLLTISRQQVLEPKLLDLNAVVVSTEKMLGRLIGEDIELVTRLGPDPGMIKADPGQIEQILLNLAVNARDAMPKGGTLSIETTRAGIRAGDEGVPAGLKPGDYIRLSVADDGCGMDEETTGRIFEPFYTTKAMGKGTGLGLAIVQTIVRQSNGVIAVESRPGEGANFRIWLPVEAGDAVAAQPDSMMTLMPKGTETVMLVEDDEAVRMLALHILRLCGYNVIKASNGKDALRIAADEPGPIHLLLSDVVMPYLGGRSLAEQFMELRPDTRVLFMSGYTDDAILRHGVLDAEYAFLQKPFTPSSLAQRVRGTLDAPKRGEHRRR